MDESMSLYKTMCGVFGLHLPELHSRERLNRPSTLREKRSLVNAPLLDWYTFIRNLDSTLPVHEVDSIRAVFDKFLALVKKQFQKSHLAVQNIAWELFNSLKVIKHGGFDVNRNRKVKVQLEQKLGLLDDSFLVDILPLITELDDWRCNNSTIPLSFIPRNPATQIPSLESSSLNLVNFHALLDLSEDMKENESDTTTTRNSNFVSSKQTASREYSTSWMVERIGSEELASLVIQKMHSLSDAALQEELFVLFGEEQFELLAELFQNKHAIIEATKDFVFGSFTTASSGANTIAAAPREYVPSVTTGITINTELGKKKSKKQIKAERKMAKRSFLPDNQTEVEDPLASIPLQKSTRKVGKITLPSGSVRKDFEKWEEVWVPPPKMSSSEEKTSLIRVDEALNKFGQVAFKGIKFLNVLQSKCYYPAYHSNENLLVCAPTGAGKTNVSMLAILHQFNQNIEQGVLMKDRFKIIYVAPMKALAQEIVSKFSKRLAPLNVIVKELTGDMQLTRHEIERTQIIVTTPEKWDVVTRKSGAGGGDGTLTSMVKLLIIDEVHLLHEDRGAVIESLIARTLRKVESSQQMIRIVGLSATLPNYADVASFLRVNPQTGLLVFDNRYRPVPLEQTFIGVKESNPSKQKMVMNDIAFDKVSKSVAEGNQAMVFVHSRKETFRTASRLGEIAQERGLSSVFLPGGEDSESKRILYQDAERKISKCQNNDMKKLFPFGLGIHHAGMVRSDRTLTEKLFSQGLISVLCCTATLAWGVNLPAHTVIIKGTEIYDSKKGGFIDVGMLDVMQIFGRAGRPQFDTSGEGMIISSKEKLSHYLTLLTHQLPIESQFITSLPDNLNAEVVLGTVSTLQEALAWLSYTYLFVRMQKNPTAYGISFEEITLDPSCLNTRKRLLLEAAKQLMECKMVRFDVGSGNFFPTDLGRICSFYYIHHESVLVYNQYFYEDMSDEDIFHVLSLSKEFSQIQVRDDELNELELLVKKYCHVKVRGGVENSYGKVNILMQTSISRGLLKGSSLISDTYFISQSVGRLCRALFEIFLKKGWSGMASKMLVFCKMVERKLWYWQSPLRQLTSAKPDLCYKLEDKGLDLSRILELEPDEIGGLLHHQKLGVTVSQLARKIPRLSIEASLQPLTRTVIRMSLNLTADFTWSDHVHGSAQIFMIWVEDSFQIYHHEEVRVSKKVTDFTLEWAIPIFEPLPSQYIVRVFSYSWLSGDTMIPVSFQHLLLPEIYPPHTPLLNLSPLPITALHNSNYQKLFSFSHFNPLQTQIFFAAHRTDENLLVGAPTGSGKTCIAELTMMRLWNEYPSRKVVYVAPLKALARQRTDAWTKSLTIVAKKVVEVTGDTNNSSRIIDRSDVIITTPEKWDGLSRGWKKKSYIQNVGLVIFDEIHLLGQERGAVLETIVSRMRTLPYPCRLVGLSTALSNARDLAEWLEVPMSGLFNFSPSVRPVPLTVHISGFPGKYYCPRMSSMNKPVFAAITTYSPEKPVLVFVASRRQTRLTAMDLVFYCASEGTPRRFSNLSEHELERLRSTISDASLLHCIEFGIGLHHAGLSPADKSIVEALFESRKIQILVCTSTLAWGVNLPAHLVVIKGTEYFNAKESRYVDFPLTDVLQMMGRAGRPQYDVEGRACIMVQESKKNFYRKFLYESFPVESSLLEGLADTFNAEIVIGTIRSLPDALEYLSWTFFFRRLMMNPSYYFAVDSDSTEESIQEFLHQLIKDTFKQLEEAGCLEFVGDELEIEPTFLGRIASFYYISHKTVKTFSEMITSSMQAAEILSVLCECTEFSEFPVRHNEDQLNQKLSEQLPLPVDLERIDSPHIKAHLLLQARMSKVPMPIPDYITDTHSLLDQCPRILQALVDISAEAGYLETTLEAMKLMQMISSSRWTSSISSSMKISTDLPESVTADEDFTVNISMKRVKSRRNDFQSESWWIVVGIPETNELVALKRTGFKNNSQITLYLEEPGETSLVFYLVSDKTFEKNASVRQTITVKEQ